ncbi:MAG: ATP-binding protein [Cyanobacteriota/Melainabacteria group bacterium]|nr:PAS domain S-box protein [Cyanobacteria bacterium HKST-UBA01]MCB9472070.1 PAS domain S-box protein [Candidatus Obscuribacterales bacterium]
MDLDRLVASGPGANPDRDLRSKLLASIVESSEDAIISFLLDGTVMSWNRGAQELFGYSVEMTMGKTLKHLIGPEMENVIASLDRGASHRIHEISYIDPHGHLLYLSLRVSPILDEEGKVGSGAAIFRDITALKQYEEELLKTSRRLEHLNQELKQFTWVAAHDLREPVRNMATYARLLQSDYYQKLDEEGRQFLDYIARSSVKAMERLDAVLKYSELDQEELSTSAVDLNIIVAKVLENLSEKVEQSEARVDVKKLPVVNADADHMEELFFHLLDNALKFKGVEPPLIEIDAVSEGGFWTVSVTDNGIGIGEENVSRVFEMFQRLNGDSYPGEGLGLAIAKKIVELHRGGIRAETSPQGGSVFRFILEESSV